MAPKKNKSDKDEKSPAKSSAAKTKDSKDKKSSPSKAKEKKSSASKKETGKKDNADKRDEIDIAASAFKPGINRLAYYNRDNQGPAWFLSWSVHYMKENKIRSGDPFWVSLGSLYQIYEDFALTKMKKECMVPKDTSVFDLPCTLPTEAMALRVDQLLKKFLAVMNDLRRWQARLSAWRVQEDRVILCWWNKGKKIPCTTLPTGDIDDIPDLKFASTQEYEGLLKFVARHSTVVAKRALVEKQLITLVKDINNLRKEVLAQIPKAPSGPPQGPMGAKASASGSGSTTQRGNLPMHNWLSRNAHNLLEFVYTYMELLQADERVTDAAHLIHAYDFDVSVNDERVKQRVALPLYNAGDNGSKGSGTSASGSASASAAATDAELLPSEKYNVYNSLRGRQFDKVWNNHIRKQTEMSRSIVAGNALSAKHNTVLTTRVEKLQRKELNAWMSYELLTQESLPEEDIVVEEEDIKEEEDTEEIKVCDFTAPVPTEKDFTRIAQRIDPQSYEHAFGFINAGTLAKNLKLIFPKEDTSKLASKTWLEKLHASRNHFFDYVNPDSNEEDFAPVNIPVRDQRKRETHLRELLPLAHRRLVGFDTELNRRETWDKDIWALALQDAVLFFQGVLRIDFADVSNLQSCWRGELFLEGTNDENLESFYETVNAFLLALNRVLSLTIERFQLDVKDIGTTFFQNGLTDSAVYLTTAHHLYTKNEYSLLDDHHWVQIIERERQRDEKKAESQKKTNSKSDKKQDKKTETKTWREDLSWVPVEPADQTRYFQNTLFKPDEFNLEPRRYALIDYGLTHPVTSLWKVNLKNAFQVARLQTDIVRQRLYPKELRVALKTLNEEKGKHFDRLYLDWMATADYDHNLLPQALAHNSTALFPLLEHKETWKLDYSIKPSLVKAYVRALDSKLAAYRRLNPLKDEDEAFDEEAERKLQDKFLEKDTLMEDDLEKLVDQAEVLVQKIREEKDEKQAELYQDEYATLLRDIKRLERAMALQQQDSSDFADVEAEEGDAEDEDEQEIVALKGSISQLENALENIDENDFEARDALETELDNLTEQLRELQENQEQEAKDQNEKDQNEDEDVDEEETKDKSRVETVEDQDEDEQDLLDSELEAETKAREQELEVEQEQEDELEVEQRAGGMHPRPLPQLQHQQQQPRQQQPQQQQQQQQDRAGGIGWNRFLSRPL